MSTNQVHAPPVNGQRPRPGRSVERIVRRFIQQAWQLQASDLYLLADRQSVAVAVRRWGQVFHLAKLIPTEGRHCITYIKALAGVDIAERRKPHDGRWFCECDGEIVDLRISSIPTRFGEDVTIRLLPPEETLPSLGDLGLSSADSAAIQQLLANPSGLILLCGPTGAGKTTTLYACLKQLNDGTRKINTLEDPIEYTLPGVRQSQVNAKIGLDFVELLVSVLRQAPDVIVVGEIRDAHTAAVALRAANSGHLVFATIHAPRAVGAVQSMFALGVEPLFVANALLGVISQRLVRTLCPFCRTPANSPPTDAAAAQALFADSQRLVAASNGAGDRKAHLDSTGALQSARGCRQCDGRGYSGRTGLFEILTVDRGLRDLITSGAPASNLFNAAVSNGMHSFRTAAVEKIALGRVSVDEVLRAVPGDFLE